MGSACFVDLIALVSLEVTFVAYLRSLEYGFCKYLYYIAVDCIFIFMVLIVEFNKPFSYKQLVFSFVSLPLHMCVTSFFQKVACDIE